MEGKMQVSYKMLCEDDFYQQVDLQEILSNEKVLKTIKSEFAKGMRNISLVCNDTAKIELMSEKDVYTLEVDKRDFADLIELAEEDARTHKRIKKGCNGIELVDFVTL
ncbi:MAG: hypothetical protein IE885_06950 [Campylobacterales bacterium]|nr:hypothetical protein [Campylobacterales bacterium]